jgi:hypothetical protein
MAELALEEAESLQACGERDRAFGGSLYGCALVDSLAAIIGE